ncbi:MAG TPA: hypothetical protein VJV77_01005 [Casimicrobiaceae bacterium]|nr:hypothetical protein [Casimicrobiaceae bacterium]
MSMRALGGALLACLFVTGCATMEPRVQRAGNKLDCDGSRECAVTVNVDCKRYFTCDVWVDYDMVAVVNENRAQDIRWKLVGEPNAEFTSDGISFRNSAFDCNPEGKQAFVCRDSHPGFGVFKYTVNVTLKDSPFGPRGVQSLDRWVANR